MATHERSGRRGAPTGRIERAASAGRARLHSRGAIVSGEATGQLEARRLTT